MSDPVAQDKPRRLEDETAQYLSEIDTQFSALERDDEDARSVLVTNVLMEIQARTASAACDRRTNYLVEQLVAHADPATSLQLMQKWTVYSVFLARNRFASHIVQTMLARVSLFIKEGMLGEIDSSEWEETILAFCRPLIHEMQWLGKEMSASHVLRSVISLLAGLPPIAEKKGKNSKHQHSVMLALPLDAMLHPGKFYFTHTKAFAVPQSFKDELLSGVDTLLRKSRRDIQVMIADISSCALLSLLLRTLSNPALFPHAAGCAKAQKLFNAALELSSHGGKGGEEEEENAEREGEGEESTSSVFYAMAGDRAGSYFLETLCEVSELSFLLRVVRQNVLVSPSAARDYALDAHGNFVLQAIAKRLSTELHAQFVESLEKSLRKEAERVSGELLAALVEENFAVRLLASNKAGVVNWLLSLAIAGDHAALAQRIAQSLLHFWQALASLGVAALDDEAAVALDIDAAYAEDEIARFLSERFVAPPTLGHGKGGKGGADKGKKTEAETTAEDAPPLRNGGGLPDSQQLLIARLLGTLLHINVPETKTSAAKIVTSLSQDALKVIATSGPMSKAVLDEFFAEFANAQEMKTIGVSLVGIGVQLACHFVGQHVVRRVYDFSDLRGKEKWAQLLSSEVNMLNKTKEGRNSLALVNVELFQRDAAEWRAAVKKQLKASSLLADVTSSSAAAPDTKKKPQSDVRPAKKSKTETAPVIHTQTEKKTVAEGDKKEEDDGSDDEDNEDGAGKKRKRKRKRPQNKSQA